MGVGLHFVCAFVLYSAFCGEHLCRPLSEHNHKSAQGSIVVLALLINSLYSTELINLMLAMLEKNVHRRPFIDTVIKLFPKSLHALTNEVDIENYRRYRKNRGDGVPFDLKSNKLALEFEALKNQLLESNPEKFLFSRQSNLPTISVCRRRFDPSQRPNKTSSVINLQAKNNRATSNISTKSELFSRNVQVKMAANVKFTLQRNKRGEENAVPKAASDIIACNTDYISDTKRLGGTSDHKYRFLGLFLAKEKSLINRIRLRGRLNCINNNRETT
eukprot:TRINITY_DN4684_c0_g1_i3.p1 TRINITY_DN4684_c0_g1~~TRINITY_DN4684_c0_g1_i3.p1  ORF type:complete len:274 (+),score=36.65 TRINITY_DN4684_c0_g1_i3:273-1094(+)